MISNRSQKNTVRLRPQSYFGFLKNREDGSMFLNRVRRSEKEKSYISRLRNRNKIELVVLVDDHNKEIGTALKDIVHTTDTPLHRGFSLFLFNSKGELLLTKRSSKKKTFPGVWTNTVCGHPGPGESAIDAARRRLKDELGIVLRLNPAKQGLTLTSGRIQEVAPYWYRFADKNGIVENEICPILIACSDVNPKLDINEVEEWKWMKWEKFLSDIKINPEIYSPWCREEAKIIVPLV